MGIETGPQISNLSPEEAARRLGRLAGPRPVPGTPAAAHEELGTEEWFHGGDYTPEELAAFRDEADRNGL